MIRRSTPLRTLSLLLLAPVLAALLSACGQTQPPGPSPTVVREQTVVLDDASRAGLLEVRPDGVLVFADPVPAGAGASPSGMAAATRQAADLKAGSVIVSEPAAAAPDGLLRVVTSVDTSTPGKVLVATRQGLLGDALQSGHLSAETELTAADLETARAAQGVQLARVQEQGAGLSFSIQVVISDTDGDTATKDDQIVASGQIDFKPTIKLDLDLDCGFLCVYDNDLDFLGQISLQETAKLKISGKGVLGANLKKTIPLATFNFGAQTFFIGPVPVVITPRIVLELRFDGSIGITVSYELSQTLQAVAGAKYDGDWENISSLSNDFSAGPVGVPSAVSVVLDAKATAALRGELMLYGIVGPTLEFAPSVRFDLKYPRDPIWKLYGGIAGNVGVKIDVLGYSKSYSTNLWDDSVQVAESTNTKPDITFLSDGSADVDLGKVLRVQVMDPEDGPACCAVTFRSSNTADGTNGALGSASGTQPEVDVTFRSMGARTITATATDSKGATSSATLVVTVGNSPPTVYISVPFGGQTFYTGQTFTARGLGYDVNGATYQMPCNSLIWTSSVASDTQPIPGCEPTLSFSSLGARTLTLTATDAHGASDTASVNVTVVAPPDNLPPVVNLTAPVNGLTIGPDQTLTLAGTAVDPEGGAVSVAWDVTTGYDPASGTGGTTFTVTPGPDGAWTPSDTIPYDAGGGCQEVSDTLRLRLLGTDPQSVVGSDFIVLFVSRIC